MMGRWQGGRERLFKDDRDYSRFLEQLEERIDNYGIRLYLFCLMANHYHLLLETPEGNLSRFMQSLATAYTVYYNLRHQRHGHLLDGRFKAKVVSGDEYLLRLSRYVHQNPVWVGDWKDKPIPERIEHLRRYRWSSYPGYVGQKQQFAFVDEGPILAMIGGRPAAQRRGYAQFVENGLAGSDEELMAALHASATGIGDEDFLRGLEARRAAKVRGWRRKEDVSFRRMVQALEAPVVLEVVSEVLGVKERVFHERRRNSPLRGVAAKSLVAYASLTQRAVAELLDMGTGSAVSAQMGRLSERLQHDRKLANKLKEINQRLDQERSC